jgi:hypothetical protein
MPTCQSRLVKIGQRTICQQAFDLRSIWIELLFPGPVGLPSFIPCAFLAQGLLSMLRNQVAFDLRMQLIAETVVDLLNDEARNRLLHRLLERALDRASVSGHANAAYDRASQPDSLHLAQCNLVFCPVAELGCSRRLMSGHLLARRSRAVPRSPE